VIGRDIQTSSTTAITGSETSTRPRAGPECALGYRPDTPVDGEARAAPTAGMLLGDVIHETFRNNFLPA
jgi:hypothetical protein